MQFILVLMVGLDMASLPLHPFVFETKDDCMRAANVATFVYSGEEKFTATCFDQNGKRIGMFGKGPINQ
jgi:hypothetical protein